MKIDASFVEEWLAMPPTFEATLEVDARALEHYLRQGEAFIAQLPAKSKRVSQEKLFADRILNSCRHLRISFMDRHAHEIYTILTHDFSKHYSLSELVFSAAEKFRCLVPSRKQIEAEQAMFQADKDGLEIDQAIFFRGLLRIPSVGLHLADAMLLPSPRALNLVGDLQRSDKMDIGLISFERRDNAAHLTINNQAHLNSENTCLIDDMETAVDLVLLDERIKVAVLRGGIMNHARYCGKRVFSAGINLRDLHAGKISFVDFLLKREFGYISKILHGLLREPTKRGYGRTIQKPWIAAVDSFAIGGGMQLLLLFDKVIAADDAYFVLPAAQEGIVPGAANLRLTAVAGSRLARQILLSGLKIYARDHAAQWLCDEVVPSHEMETAIESAVQEFDNPAVVENRRLLVWAEEPRDRFRAYMAEFAYIQAMRINSPDVLDKIESFVRRPKNAPMLEETMHAPSI